MNIEKNLCSINGVIDTINNDSIRVKFQNNIYANLPIVLFDEDIIKPGQSFTYMIKINSEGYRYQDIVPMNPVLPDNEEDLKQEQKYLELCKFYDMKPLNDEKRTIEETLKFHLEFLFEFTHKLERI
jgi:hypothetical protein